MDCGTQQVSDARSARGATGLAAACLRWALDWLYPRHCHHCGRSLHEGRARILCGACFRELVAGRIAGTLCELCGLPLAGEQGSGALCLTCRTERRHFDLARALFAYRGPASSVIRAFKFEGEFSLGAQFLEAALERGWLPPGIGPAEVVLPVPLHRRRRRERGYDQASLLARVLARRLGTRFVSRALVRTRYTSQQALLPAARRWDNVRGAFAVRAPASVRGRRVLLVDDVMTSGTTADECAKVLKRAGAAHIQVLTLARTTP
jgi:ComF family protein